MFIEDFFEFLNTLWAMTVLDFEKCKKVKVYFTKYSKFRKFYLVFS